MGIKKEEVQESRQDTKEKAEKVHDVKEEYSDPGEVLEEMASRDEYEGVAFSIDEVREELRRHIEKIHNEMPEYNEPKTAQTDPDDTLESYLIKEYWDEEIKGNIANDEEVKKYVREKIEEAEDVKRIVVNGDEYFGKKEVLERL